MLLLASLHGCRCASTTSELGHTPRAPAALPAPISASELEQAWAPPAKETNSARVIWWEAETPRATDFPARHSLQPENEQERALLSGGAWLGTDPPGRSLFVEYEVEVPEQDPKQTYSFYVRKFWLHGPFRWHFDQQPWQACTQDTHLLDAVQLRTHVSANWVQLGQVELGSGRHTLRVELSDPASAAAFDAFVLSQGAFLPRGKLKPQEQYPDAPMGWTTFDPAADSLQPSPLDLRSLNQTRAGVDGFVEQQGGQLVFERTKQPVRFWGIDTGHDVLKLSPELARRFARRLAEFGVNLVRLHGPIYSQDAPRQVLDERIDAIQRLATVLGDEGIYLGLSIYFPAWLHLKPSDGFGGYNGQSPYALSFFDAQFEDIERGWWRALLTRANRHSGVALAADPTIAYVELLNEDSTLFWTFAPYENLPEAQTVALETRFGQWLSAKYGRLEAAFETWSSDKVRGDDAAAGRAGFVPLWQLTNGDSARSRDTAEFLTRSMRDHYARLRDSIEHELGYRGLTVCSNWTTADERVLGPLDNWANTVCDVMDRHAYVSGPHEGEAAEYAVVAGQMFDDYSALKAQAGQRGVVPAFIEPRYNDKPAFISELGWTWPNRFRAEGPLLTAAYAGLHGVDGPVWFMTGKPDWATALDKFELQEPVTFGQFPAAALIYRRGLVKEGQSVAAASLSERDLFALKGAPIAATTGLDAFRAGDVRGTASSKGAINPFALLVGPVDLNLGGPNSTASLDGSKFEPFIDDEHAVVRSSTGELRWDFDVGVVKLDSPRANAALGFLAHDGPLELSALTISLRNEYAAIALVALDDAPLDRSERLLLQVATESTNTGWEAQGTGKRTIQAVGGPAILIKNAEGSVALKRADAAALRVSALDANGALLRRSRGGADRILLLPNAPYYLIER